MCTQSVQNKQAAQTHFAKIQIAIFACGITYMYVVVCVMVIYIWESKNISDCHFSHSFNLGEVCLGRLFVWRTLNTHIFEYTFILLSHIYITITHTHKTRLLLHAKMAIWNWVNLGVGRLFVSHTSNTHVYFYFLTHILPSHKPKHT